MDNLQREITVYENSIKNTIKEIERQKEESKQYNEKLERLNSIKNIVQNDPIRALEREIGIVYEFECNIFPRLYASFDVIKLCEIFRRINIKPEDIETHEDTETNDDEDE